MKKIIRNPVFGSRMSAVTIILAILFAILAYSMLNIGLALEKKGAAELPVIEEEKFFRNLKNFFTNKIWITGFILTNIQWIFFLLALEFGDLSLVTPMMGIGLVALVLFSYFYLKEPISIKEISGIVCIIIGAVVLGATNSGEEIAYTIDEINSYLSSLGSIIFFICSSILIVVSVLFSIIRKFSLADIIFGISGGIASGLGAIFSKAFISGLDFGDFGSSFIAAVIRWEWWMYLLLLIIFNIISTVLPQIGFQKGKAIRVTPLFSIMALISPVIGGVIIFAEWSNLSIGFLIGKIIALIVITIGVIIISITSVQQKSTDEPKNEEENERKIN